MDSTDFSVLVGRLERESDRAPQLYLGKVAVVAALGYVWLGLAILASAVSAFFLVTSLLAHGQPSVGALLGCVAGVAALLAMLRAMWVTPEPPGGRAIEREEAPALFAELDDIVQWLQASADGKVPATRIEAVTLDRQFALGLQQIPTRSVFGKYRNYLHIGLPLLAALSVAEYRAVLAHELGHLGVRDTFSAWIYRQRFTWLALQRKLAQPANVVERVLGVYFDWYVPTLHAYTLVLARNHEHAADELAAHLTSAPILAQTLVKLELMGRFLSDVFWKRLFDQVEKVAEPQYLPYSMLPKAFVLAQKEWRRGDWLHEAMRRVGESSDTHPSLAQRLAALDVRPTLPDHSAEDCALTLLGGNAAALLKACDEEWRTENGAAWRQRHDAIREARWKIAQYDATPAADLKPDDLWEKAALLLDLDQRAEGIETLQTLIAMAPTYAKGQVLLGKLLLEQADERGLDHLLTGAHHDAQLMEAAGQTGYGYLVHRGRKREAERFWSKIASIEVNGDS